MGKSSPQAPDPAAQNAQQTASNVDTAVANAYINNPNIVSPYGNVNSTQTGTQKVGGVDVPTFTQTTTLSPSQQKQFDMTQGLQNQALGIGGQVLNNVGSVTSTPFTLDGLPAAPTSGSNQAARDQATNAIIQRNQPQMDRTRASQQSQLANQGIMPGSEAYKNAMDDISRQENDFDLGAIGAGDTEQNTLFNQDTQARQNALSNELTARSQPINEYATLLGLGGQVQAPQVQYQGSNVAPTDTSAAANTAYAGKVSQYNAQNQLYGNLIGAGGSLGAASILKSDIRLKSDIKFEGMEGKYPIYQFSYRADPERKKYRGVMAQDMLEIMPDAVVMHNGVLAVNYNKIGVEFRRVC